VAPAAHAAGEPFPARLRAAQRLNRDGSEKDTRLVVLDTQTGAQGYQVGDSLGVVARNCPELVGAIIERLGAIAPSTPGVPLDKMPGGKGFTERFNAKYGQIQIYAPFAYDAVMTLVDAMQKANSAQPAKYLPELAKISYQGVTGPIAFDEKGDLRSGPITLYVVKGGKWDTLETVGGGAAAQK